MKPIKTLLTSFTLLALVSTASAGRYDNNYEYAQVVDVQSIYENYQIPETRRVCDNGNYNGNNNRTRYSQSQSNGGGAILGGIIGGIIGNRFGKGHGRRAATAAGVLVGSSIGSKARPKGYYSNNRSNNRNSRNNRQCYSQREYRTEQRLNGYNVSYDYNGRIYQTRMQNHPGDRVRVQVNVQVADY